jgi:hypothetical protein
MASKCDTLIQIKQIIDEYLSLSLRDAYLKNIDILISMPHNNVKKLTELKKLIIKDSSVYSWQERNPRQQSEQIFGTNIFNFSLNDLYRICFDDAWNKIKLSASDSKMFHFDLKNPLDVKFHDILDLIYKALVDEFDIITSENISKKEKIDKMIDDLIVELGEN